MTTDYDAPREDTQDRSQLEDPDVQQVKARLAAQDTGTDPAYAAAHLDPAGDTDDSSATFDRCGHPPATRRVHLQPLPPRAPSQPARRAP